jgi:methyltransferase (TIGR00027 family)
MAMSENSTPLHVSDTALWVATYRADETRRPDALFQDPLAEKLAGPRGQEIAASMPHHKIMQWVLTVRTVAIDRLIQQALELGVDVVVNLGAGLDTRPYRMSLAKDLLWIEVDFPPMIQYKSEKLKDEAPRCQLERMSVDLSNTSERRACLQQIAARGRKILVISEGVIPYLDETQARDLSQDLIGTTQIAYWILDYRRGDIRLPKRIRRAMKDVPFKLRLPDEMAFFQSHGWQLHADIPSFTEGRRIQRPFPLPFPWNVVRRVFPDWMDKQATRQTGYALLAKSK